MPTTRRLRHWGFTLATASIATAALATACDVADTPNENDAAKPGLRPSRHIALEGLPNAPYRAEFTREAAAMPDGPLKDLAYEYAWSLYDEDEVLDTIVDYAGRTVDCVDLQRQPSLRQADGTYAPIPTGSHDVDDDPPATKVRASAEDDEPRCPHGSFPRVRDDQDGFRGFVDVRQTPARGTGGKGLWPDPTQRHVDNWYGSAPFDLPQYSTNSGYEHARATQHVNNQGMSATLAVYHPTVTNDSEHSISQLWLMGEGPNNDCSNPAWGYGTCDSVEVGWVTTSTSAPRFFIYSTRNNYAPGSGCWVGESSAAWCANWFYAANTPIFSDDHVTGSTKTSRHPENQEIAIKIRKDGGIWEVFFGGDLVGGFTTETPICGVAGCSPHPWYSTAGLHDRSNLIRYGGEIINMDQGNGVTNRHTTTEMGTGQYANAASGDPPAAYQHKLLYYPNPPTSNGVQPTLDVTSTWPTIDNDYSKPGCYSLKNTGTPWPGWGSEEYIFFGGSGYNSSSCQ